MRISMAIVSCAATATLLFGCSTIWHHRQVLPVSDAASPLVGACRPPPDGGIDARPRTGRARSFLSRIARAGHDARRGESEYGSRTCLSTI